MCKHADEIEVTDEMVEAGSLELAGFSPSVDHPKEIVKSIYLAMALKFRFSGHEGSAGLQ